ALGATQQGVITSIVHDGWNETAIEDTYLESSTRVTPIMYATPNLLARHSVIPVNTVNPGWMRAPGENVSAFALETAMDELAYKAVLILLIYGFAIGHPATRKTIYLGPHDVFERLIRQVRMLLAGLAEILSLVRCAKGVS
uniref:molybdopterin cofactor-binding domain-containing protein n=1 Tax=Pseudomonas viridiflava TaxID=33069 RepID=UPI0019CFBE7D